MAAEAKTDGIGNLTVTVPLYTKTSNGEYMHLGDARMQVPLQFDEDAGRLISGMEMNEPITAKFGPQPLCNSCGRSIYDVVGDIVVTREGFRHCGCPEV